MKLIKNIIILNLLLLTFINNAHADLKDVEKFTFKFTSKIFEIIQKKTSIDDIRKELIEEISENININVTAKFVLGKYWKQCNVTQQNYFKKIFKDYLILNYAPKFQGYNDESFNIIETKKLAPGKYSSKIKVSLSDNTNFEIILYIIEHDKKFKIVDIVGEGISFSATQRTEFYYIIKNNGIEKFLEILNQKVIKLKNS
ncbi:MAG: ABC transporter substrate-binding protein [Alphaproteobacteria bacterium]|jgi:phospholipid transport system substrate-binding protein|nr:ABC transporter substrate-binding protein [Alphaproteobacteria bacterium]MBT5828045.1 ABC transporter substrate-binding protein [Alphaproteobacteria bacterium]